jgi:hypothetical protein
MIRNSHRVRSFACSIVLAALLAALSATPALAAPSFKVTLERDSAAFPAVTHSDERVDYTVKVKNVGADPTNGTVTMELELPGGAGTFAHKIETSGWSCASSPPSEVQNARAICANSAVLAPGAEYPAVKVVAALGADVPDVAKATASAFGAAAAPASDSLAFVVGAPLPLAMTKFTAAAVDNEAHDYTQAGGHSFAALSEVSFTRKRPLVPAEFAANPVVPIEDIKQVIVDAPRGFVGNASALPELCPGLRPDAPACSAASAVGGIEINISITAQPITATIYALEPEFGVPAQFGFQDPNGNIYTFAPHLRADDGYAISFTLAPAPEVGLLDSTVTLCNFGPVLAGGQFFQSCKEKGEPGANPKALFTNPTRCGTSLFTRGRFNSWHNQATFIEAPPFENAKITGCEKVKFEPDMKELKPSSKQADSPSGLDVTLTMPTEGLEDPEGISQANIKQTKVTFPKGMAINGAAGQGLGSCSAAQVKLGTNLPVECPLSSKIGSMEVETPLIESTLKGDVYIAKQGDVKGALTGFYIVFDAPKEGILIKVPAKVEPDPVTGQITTTIEELPEAPFSKATLHFPGGPHATLITPPKCGKYEISSELVPWTGTAPVTQTNSFEVTEGPNGGPCPKGNLEPKLSAGSENPAAGQTSSFNFRLFREDGTDRFASLSMKTPLGLTAYLKGVPYCPDSVINSISGEVLTGQAQIEHPSCPAASQIGTAIAGAGAGSDPFFVKTGKVYLAGPYKGAPVSIVAVAPAVAGPLDLGNVVIRNPIYIDPESTQITIQSDPIPTILHGVLPDIRDIRVQIDRSHFTLNPTSCEAKEVKVDVKGESGQSASVSNRFQVGGCEKLGFKPQLTTTLTGPTKRAGHPSLKGVLVPRPGDANLKQAVVTIPRSEFLDQAHIRTICTRVQFAANACPKGSIYGHAEATTPLLDQPLSGPVYLRSSSHKLPDLVVAVKGPDSQPIEAAAVARIDSINGQIRASFEATPDVPLTKVVIQMQGGKKGLLINSRDICSRAFRASLELEAHNGSAYDATPVLKNGKCGAGRKAKRGQRSGSRRAG